MSVTDRRSNAFAKHNRLIASIDTLKQPTGGASLEEDSASSVLLGIPEERRRIRELLACFPRGVETKASELIHALGELWQANADEKVVVFATYLGSVEALRAALEEAFPGKGVEILKGGDHGGKLAAEKRFKSPNGPKVLISTAAGREGINLQFARVLFNYDLPWNPMDLEQRIGRIHRYGQKYTAQIYNFVALDTIEGEIYLLLEEKLLEIARTLGKVDENGQVAEDLRGQILGQLSERLSYERLYQEAVRDPTLSRSRQEIEVALDNATRARHIVFELFQDLEGFNLADYHAVDDRGEAMARLCRFMATSAEVDGQSFTEMSTDEFSLYFADGNYLQFTTDRDRAITKKQLQLLGLEHQVVRSFLDKWSSLEPGRRSVYGRFTDQMESGLITVWRVDIHSRRIQSHKRLVTIAVNQAEERCRSLERLADRLLNLRPEGQQVFSLEKKSALLDYTIPAMLRRELLHSGVLDEESSFSLKLLALIECCETFK